MMTAGDDIIDDHDDQNMEGPHGHDEMSVIL